ncbi:thiolase family protein [Actinomadura vinacea]|uniref:Thiolase family protein n=1 Tax=Actinomadura vinacea TaxID=115336 RepID=A0ABN3KB42_9ACTN
MDVAIIGIGMHPFGRHEGVGGRAQGAHAAREALKDAGVDWGDIRFAAGGSRDGGDADSLVADLGLTGVPFVNVWNGCATGGSALTTTVNAIEAGAVDLGMVIGFDKHPRGAFNPDPVSLGLGPWYGETGLMVTTQFFGMKAQRYLHDHGIAPATLAKVAVKAFGNGSLNPNAWRRKPLSEEEVLASPMLSHPLTQYMFCSPGEGAVAMVLCRGDLARRYTAAPVYLRAAELRTRRFGSFEVFSPWIAPERAGSPSVDAARAAFEAAGIGPREIDLAQLQDTESGAEIIHMAECGLCEHGEQGDLVASGATAIGGALPVNTDGGCLANGEPIGASGLRQVYENVLQLRGAAGPRQVPGSPRAAFTHVYGAPGVSACTVLTT